ncbi:LysR family transcriptional regulator [Desulfitobacterium metallireducens]|uniref:Transcriptional regulator n=1 Tax=Desulfitobacterium metallireducens DSM 15288 TaxID=871968 RepID=W0EBC7_9FIRM|nr:LysR family transcriptional regulator [Desulfitobacterium metallireducens]AHF06519.1 transcriptional regulator [Desulfitobacterium metallireducens DSM 15288]
MDIQQFRAFREVARQRSFSGAAKELFLSQPAISRQVAALETEIGLPLFVRMGNNISLTDPGRRLLIYVDDILLKLDQAESVIRDLKDLESGTVIVAADNYLGKYFLPRFIGEFHRRYPTLQLHLITHPQESLVGLLANGQADLAFFCGEPKRNLPLTFEQLCTEELCFVAPGSLNLDIAGNIEKYAPFLFPPKSSSFGEDYELLLPVSIDRTNSLITIESLEGIRTLLNEGFGCSILPKNLIHWELEKGFLQSMPIGLECPVILTYPKDTRLAHPVLLFMGVIHKMLSI